MKNIIKHSILILIISSFASCLGNFEKYNTDPYAQYKPQPNMLLAAMIEPMMFVQQNSSQMVDQMVGTLGGYYTLSNRWGGANFDTFNASDEWNAQTYNITFETVYANFFRLGQVTENSGHYYALGLLLRGATMMRVADCYGAIPYSKVADRVFYVEYDSAEDVYQQIIADLSSAATTLFAYSESYPALKPFAANDPIFAGDYGAWARLANSLCLRAAIRVGDQEAAEAACTHSAGLIETNSDNAMVNTGVQGNPYQVASVSWGDLRMNSSIVDYMVGYEDPRCTSYFLKSGFDGTKYIGMRSGIAKFDKTAVQGYSLPNLESSSLVPVFVAAETSFLRAEAALRGWAVTGTAQENYEMGIRLSMEQAGVASPQIDSYIENEELTPAKHSNDPMGAQLNYDRKSTIKIKWGGDATQNLERIITQKWIANYPMGLEAWAEFRRTGYPELAEAVNNLSAGVITNTSKGMRRLRYPFTEKNMNTVNYNKAVAEFGGLDNESVDLFWAKKN